MGHCSRVGACLILFLAYLQARPINFDALGLPFIKDNVSCAHNVTFTSPSNVEPNCCAEAFRVIMEQLKQARANCTDVKGHVNYTLESLELYSRRCPQSGQRNSSHCKWENEEDKKPLAEFVDDIETFMQHRVVIERLH